MMNHVVLVGKLVKKPLLGKEENGKEFVIITLNVQRQFKNADGVYESDLIPCILYCGISKETYDLCNIGDVIGVKGRLQQFENDGIYVVAERVTFLTKNKGEE